jgi:manganese oxidase
VDGNGVKQKFRDFVLLYQDDVSLKQNGTALPNLRNADDAEDTGHKAFNYRSEPLWARLGAAPSAEPGMMSDYDFSDAFSSWTSQGDCRPDPAHGHFCDPATPIFVAEAGTQVRFRIVHPAGHPRNHGFTLFGHDWILNPWVCGSDSTVMGWNQFSQNRFGSAYGIGPARHMNILTTAGGDFHIPGDYLYRTQEGFMFAGGLWGIFRVSPETGGWHNAPPRKSCNPNP